MKYIYKSGIELAGLIRRGEATSVEIVREHLDKIKKHNDLLNAVVILMEDEALQTAEECDREAKDGHFRGPLHGVPMTIKEQFWLKGQKSTLNSYRYRNWVAPEDAVVVDRLKKAGAVIMGKTNVPKYLFDYQVWGDLYPDGRNPYKLDHSPGGSSGGSAAALASGMTPIELGGDMAGSIRIPAFFCGLFGLKPTEKTIPGHGEFPKLKNEKRYVFEMATAGPVARTADDMELVWKTIRGSHPFNREIPRVDWQNSESTKLKDYKIVWVDQWPGYEPSEEIRARIKEFVELLQNHGCKTEEISVENDLHERSLSLWIRLAAIILSQDVPGFFKPLIKMAINRTFFKGVNKFSDDFSKGLKSLFINYSETEGIRAQITGEWEQLFEGYDLLVCPMSFGPSYKRCKIGSEISNNGQNVKYAEYCWPYVACFNASGHPAMNIPLGLNSDGRPVGVQVVGPYWSEPSMIHFAKLISQFISGFVKPEGF